MSIYGIIFRLMKLKQKRVFFYIALYSAIVLILSLSLSLNIRSARLNSSLQTYNKKLSSIQEINRDLLFQVSYQTSLSRVEDIASKKLKMKPNKQVFYIKP